MFVISIASAIALAFILCSASCVPMFAPLSICLIDMTKWRNKIRWTISYNEKPHN